MKFGKHFCSQMVPEWHEAYLDYNSLKHILKDIPERKKTADPPEPNSNGLARAHTLYRAFSGLTNQGSRSIKEADIENQVILVNSVRRDGAEASETTFLNAEDEGGEHELEYFRRLDDEFFKVSKFYQKKVKEVVEEAQGLNKQMNALIAFRVKVDHPDGSWLNSMIESVELASNVEASAAMLAAKSPSAARATSRKIAMDVIEEEDSETMRDTEESNEESEESKPSDDIETGKDMKAVENSDVEENKQNHFKSKRSVPLEILEQIKLNTNLGTPRSMIKGFLNLPSQKDLDFSKTSLHKAEEQLRMAFVEFYQKLRLLKNYGFLNILAISKIMKKYDKITSRSASKSYMKMVDNSYLGTSEEVNRLIERVEATFIKHFTNSDRSLGMKCLRPTAKKERHRTTFTTGFLVGCAVSLVLALALIVRAHDILDRAGRNVYMETMFPLYSLFGFIVLHMAMYGVNIYFWRRYRVNYSFIFGFKQGTELDYREVFLVSFSIGVLALASVLANLDMEMDPVTKDYQAITELLPLGLVVLLIAIVLCPLNIMYRSSRFFLLRTLTRCVFAPLYKVTLPDFMLADQLTSQVQAIRSLQFYVCYYFWGDYKRRENHCSSNDIFISFSFIVAIVPFWWRVAQCLRRWTEEKDIMQAYNGIKYFMTIVAVCSRTTYSLNGANSWKYMALVTSIGATMFSTYWDLVIDWGLLQPNSKNRWLRDKLLVPYKSVYFIAIVLDVILRLAWMQTVMKLFTFDLHRQTIIAIMASLEIIRRGIWNFFRLENEHLNNVGKFRAFKSVPLPFNCDCDGKNN